MLDMATRNGVTLTTSPICMPVQIGDSVNALESERKKTTLLNLQGSLNSSSPNFHISEVICSHMFLRAQMQSSFILAKNARAADGDETVIHAAISTSLPGNAALLAFQLEHSSHSSHSSAGPEGGLLHH